MDKHQLSHLCGQSGFKCHTEEIHGIIKTLTLTKSLLSLLLLHSSGLNSILFAINIDNSDLNGGPTRGSGPSVSHLLKESTQGIGSLWKESTQGVSSLLREISTATAVVPGFSPRVGGASDPLPVLPRSTSAGNVPRWSLICFAAGCKHTRGLQHLYW